MSLHRLCGLVALPVFLALSIPSTHAAPGTVLPSMEWRPCRRNLYCALLPAHLDAASLYLWEDGEPLSRVPHAPKNSGEFVLYALDQGVELRLRPLQRLRGPAALRLTYSTQRRHDATSTEIPPQILHLMYQPSRVLLHSQLPLVYAPPRVPHDTRTHDALAIQIDARAKSAILNLYLHRRAPFRRNPLSATRILLNDTVVPFTKIRRDRLRATLALTAADNWIVMTPPPGWHIDLLKISKD
jgi:hypothetical protein